MSFTYERKINYYETDKMGVVHHSNYIRFLEEARCAWLEASEMPFSALEENGITIPVLEVSCSYKYHVTFADTILINMSIIEYNGVRMTVKYVVTEKETGKTVLTGETKHCFTDMNLRPVNLKKYAPSFHEKYENLLEKGENIE